MFAEAHDLGQVFPGPPDLAIETISPSTAGRDRAIRLDRYRRYGVPEYWVVDPEEQAVEVWRLADGAKQPVVHGPSASLRWTPVDGGPTLEIEREEMFAGP